MIEIECVLDAKAELGEATYWDPAAGVLWWSDIYGPTIHRFDPETGKDDTWQAPEYLGTLRRPEAQPGCAYYARGGA